MHELMIAQNIIDEVSKSAKKELATKVLSIQLMIGKLSGIEIEALKFSLEIASKGTCMENAMVDIIIKNGLAFCRNCNTIFQIEKFYDSCPSCKQYSFQIKEGKELKISSICIQ